MYFEPFLLEDSCTIRAQIFVDDEPQQEFIEETIAISKKVKSVELSAQPHKNYTGHQAYTLVDNLFGSRKHKDGKWLGYQDNSLEVTIELEKEQTIREFGISYLTLYGAWIFPPSSFDFSISDDGKNYRLIKNMKIELNRDAHNATNKHRMEGEIVNTKFIRFNIYNYGRLPDWHDATGNQAWFFIDELIFE